MFKLPHVKHTKNFEAIAVLTSGGDAPGMNAAIRSTVRFGIAQGCKVYGIQKGYAGLLEGEISELNLSSVANIIQRGGTILRTSRCPAFFKKSIRKEASHILRRKGINGLITIGGDGTFRGAHLLEKETGFPTIGIPGTIDNDIPETEDTIGFDTAVNTALEAIDRIRDTASSHDRLFVIEVMGRSTGFIASQVGIGGGAETVIIPERKISVPTLLKSIRRGIERGKKSSIIVVAEGPKPGLANDLARKMKKAGFPAHVCILGHIQRGGTPSAHDRFLATVLGASSVSFLLGGYSNCMVGVQQGEVVTVPFNRVFGKRRPFQDEYIDFVETLAH